MAKRILLGVLQDYFGRYVDGIQAENLNVAVWAGEIYLENLCLKKEMLDYLRLPVTVECGYIRKFVVHVPWSKLGSEPVRINIDGIYLLGILSEDVGTEDGHRESTVTPEASERHRNQRLPQHIIEKRIRLRWANFLSAQFDKAKSGPKPDDRGEENRGFWGRMGAKIMDNLQIEINNIHLRFEDSVNIPGSTYSFGLTMQDFQIVTCDAEGSPTFLNRGEIRPEVVGESESNLNHHKLVAFTRLSLYWDTDKPLIVNGNTASILKPMDIADILQRSILCDRGANARSDKYTKATAEHFARETLAQNKGTHSYLLHPFSSWAILTTDNSKNFSIPRYAVNLKTSRILLTISRRQFAIMYTMRRALDQNSIFSAYRQHRPIKGPLEDPRAWWRYIYVCTRLHIQMAKQSKIEEKSDLASEYNDSMDTWTVDDEQSTVKDTPKYCWLDIARQAIKREKYVSLYKASIRKSGSLISYDEQVPSAPTEFESTANRNEEDFPPHQRKIMQDLEDELEVQTILAYRAIALAELSAEDQKKGALRTQNTQYRIINWFRQLNADEASSNDDRIYVNLTEEEKSQIFEAINAFQQTHHSVISDGSPHFCITANLSEGVMALVDDTEANLLYTAHFSGTISAVNCFGGIWKYQFELHGLSLHDSSDSRFSECFLSLKDSKEHSKRNAVTIRLYYSSSGYSANQIDRKPNKMLKVRVVALPLKIIFQPKWVDGIGNFFMASRDYRTQYDLEQPLHAGNDLIVSQEWMGESFRKYEQNQFQDGNLDIDWVKMYIEKSRSREDESMSKTFLQTWLRPDIDIRMTVSAPILVFPTVSSKMQFKPHQDRTKVCDRKFLVLDLGELSFFSDERSKLNENSEACGIDDLDFLDITLRTTDSCVHQDHGEAGSSPKNIFDGYLSRNEDESIFNELFEGFVSGRRILAEDVLVDDESYQSHLSREDRLDYGNNACQRWSAVLRRIHCMVIMAPFDMPWENLGIECHELKGNAHTEKYENQRSVFTIVEDFDIHISFSKPVQASGEKQIGVALGNIEMYLTPLFLGLLLDLRREWSSVTEASRFYLSDSGLENSEFTLDASQVFSSSVLLPGLPKPLVRGTDAAEGTASKPHKKLPAKKEARFTHVLASVKQFRLEIGSSHTKAICIPLLECNFTRFQVEYLSHPEGAASRFLLSALDVIDLHASKDRVVYLFASQNPYQREQSEEPKLISINARWGYSDERDKNDQRSDLNRFSEPGFICVFVKVYSIWMQWNPDTIAAVRRSYGSIESMKGTIGKQVYSNKNEPKSRSSMSESVVLSDSGGSMNPYPSSFRKRFHFSIESSFSLSAVNLVLLKHGRALSSINLTDMSAKFLRTGSNLQIDAKLQNLSVEGCDRMLFKVASDTSLFVLRFSRNVIDKNEDNALRIDIGPSKYVHFQHVCLELLDYFGQGIVRPFFTDSSAAAESLVVNTLQSSVSGGQAFVQSSLEKGFEMKFDVEINTFQIVVPVGIHPQFSQFVGAKCTQLRVSNSKVLQPCRQVSCNLNKLYIFSDAGIILEDPIEFNALIKFDERSASSRKTVHAECIVSKIAIILSLVNYQRIKNVMRSNIAKDRPADGRYDDSGSFEDVSSGPICQTDQFIGQGDSLVDKAKGFLPTVFYNYDLGEDKLLFSVDFFFEQVSCTIGDGAIIDSKNSIALFSMNGFCAQIFRDDAEDESVVLKASARSLNLTDERFLSQNWCFRHLVIPKIFEDDGTKETGVDVFNFRLVFSTRKVEFSLRDFRGVFLPGLLLDILNFWVSNEGPIEYKKQIACHRRDVLDSVEIVDDTPQNWTAYVNIINSNIYLVPDYEDPNCPMISVRTTILFKWQRIQDEIFKIKSTWSGLAESFQACTTLACDWRDDDAPLNCQRLRIFSGEVVLNQLIEPTTFSFSTEQEKISRGNTFCTKRFDLQCNSLETYFSLGDLRLISLIVANGLRESREWHQSNTADDMAATGEHQLLTAKLKSNTVDTDILSAEIHESLADDLKIESFSSDKDYISFTLSSVKVNIGISLHSDDGFIRVRDLNPVNGKPGVCERLGIQPGDYLLNVDGSFVSNESPDVVSRRLENLQDNSVLALRFRKNESKEPLITQLSLNMSTEKLVVNWVDDVNEGDMPLSNIMLASVNVFLNGSSDGNYVLGALLDVLGTHFYDYLLGSWGILFDPCKINLSCFYFSTGVFEAMVDIPKTVSCNISDTFMRMMHNAVKSGPTVLGLGPANEKISLTTHAGYCPNEDVNKSYILKNETGLPLRFWRKGEDSCPFFVPQDALDFDFGFNRIRGTGAGALRGLSQTSPIYVAFLNPNQTDHSENSTDEQPWETLDGLRIDRIGDGVARLGVRPSHHAPGYPDLKIKWSVCIDDLTRKVKVTLTSLLRIKNFLNLDVNVMLSSAEWMSPCQLPWTIRQDESRYVSVLLYEAMSMHIQPVPPSRLQGSGGSEYDWSEPISMPLVADVSRSSVNVECTSNCGRSIFICVYTYPGEDRISTIFELHPQVRLRNLLPQDVIYHEFIELIEPEFPVGGGVIGMGEEKQLESLTSSGGRGANALIGRLEFKLETSDWADPIDLVLSSSLTRGSVGTGSHNEYMAIPFLSLNMGKNVKKRRKYVPANAFETTCTSKIDLDFFDGGDCSDSFHIGSDEWRKRAALAKGKETEMPSKLNTVVFNGNGDVCEARVLCEETKSGSMLVTIFAEYWIMNCTCLQLRYISNEKLGSSKWIRPTNLNSAKHHESVILFGPSDGKLVIGCQSASATAEVAVSVPGMHETVFIPRSTLSPPLCLGCSVDVAPGAFYRTNVITIVPRYTLYNRFDLPIRVQQAPDSARVEGMSLWIMPSQKLPFWFDFGVDSDKNIYGVSAHGDPLFRFCLKYNESSEIQYGDSSVATMSSVSRVLDPGNLMRRRKAEICTFAMPNGKRVDLAVECFVGDTAGSLVIEFSAHLATVAMKPAVYQNRRIYGHPVPENVKIEAFIKALTFVLVEDQTALHFMYRAGSRLPSERLNESERKKEAPLNSTQPSISQHALRKSFVPIQNQIAIVEIENLAFSLKFEGDKEEYKLLCTSLCIRDPAENSVFPLVLSVDRCIEDPSGDSISQKDSEDGFFKVLLIRKSSRDVGIVFDKFFVSFKPINLKLDESFIFSLVKISNRMFPDEVSNSNQVLLQTLNDLLSWDRNHVAQAARTWVRACPEFGHRGKLVKDRTAQPPIIDEEISITPAALSKSDVIKANEVVISEICTNLSFQQCPEKEKSKLIYEAGGGILSRMTLSVKEAKIQLQEFSRFNFFGSLSLLFDALKNHYESEFGNSIFVLMGAVDIRRTDFGIVNAIKNTLSLKSAKLESTEFNLRDFDSENDILDHYKKKTYGPDCRSLDQWIRLIRNFLFDWRNNHRGVYARKCLVIGVVNRSRRMLFVDQPTVPIATKTVTLLNQSDDRRQEGAMLDSWNSSSRWNEMGHCCWLTTTKSSGVLTAALHSSAFSLTFEVPGYPKLVPRGDQIASIVHSDFSKFHGLYVICVDDDIRPTK